MRIAVLEGEGRAYSRYLQKEIERKNVVCDIILGVRSGEWYDAVLVAPDYYKSDLKSCTTHALLARDCDGAELVSKIAANIIITYGTQRSTLCISSVGEKSIVALQREVIDSMGREFQIGEISVDGAIAEPEDACAIAGAMMICGLVV